MQHPVRPPSETPPAQRRPYEPPAIEESAPFETLALSCAQNAANCGDPYAYPPDPSQYDNS